MKAKQNVVAITQHSLRARCLKLISGVLDDLEHDRVMDITSIRIAAIDKMTRLVFNDDKTRGNEPANGTTIRKYASAFQTNASRGRAADARSAASVVAADDSDTFSDDGDTERDD
jgi:hypothetical protein